MIVTSVRLRLFPENLRQVRAVGSLRLDDVFQVEHIHVIQRKDGSFLVAMPSRFDEENGTYHDVAHPISASFRAELDRAVLNEYVRLTKTSRPVIVSQCPQPK